MKGLLSGEKGSISEKEMVSAPDVKFYHTYIYEEMRIIYTKPSEGLGILWIIQQSMN